MNLSVNDWKISVIGFVNDRHQCLKRNVHRMIGKLVRILYVTCRVTLLMFICHVRFSLNKLCNLKHNFASL